MVHSGYLRNDACVLVYAVYAMVMIDLTIDSIAYWALSASGPACCCQYCKRAEYNPEASRRCPPWLAAHVTVAVGGSEPYYQDNAPLWIQ